MGGNGTDGEDTSLSELIETPYSEYAKAGYGNANGGRIEGSTGGVVIEVYYKINK